MSPDPHVSVPHEMHEQQFGLKVQQSQKQTQKASNVYSSYSTGTDMLPSDGISAEKSLYPQVITANQHVDKACLEEYEQGVQYNQGYNYYYYVEGAVGQDSNNGQTEK